jgi:hypothetical protein
MSSSCKVTYLPGLYDGVERFGSSTTDSGYLKEVADKSISSTGRLMREGLFTNLVVFSFLQKPLLCLAWQQLIR